jgi:L-malate glycosyltransferase
MKKVLVIDNSSHFTGAIKSIRSLTSFLKDSFNIYYAIPRKSAIKNLSKGYVIKINFLEIKRSWSVLFYLPLLIINSIRIFGFIQKEHIKIIHVNDLYNMCGVLVKIFYPSMKLVYHIRLLPSSYAGRLYPIWRALIVKYADEIICVSEAVRKNWPESNKVHVIYDAINYEDRISTDREFEQGKIRFLYLANYIQGKGQQYALDAFRQVQKEIKNVELVFAGSDMGLKKNQQFKQKLVQQAEDYGLAELVLFKDFIEDIEPEMKQADIFLNFSDSESFSMTCLEALYFGTPCIATNSGGPSEIIVDGECGFVVPLKDVQAMVGSMIKLASSVELRKQFSDNGKRRAKEHFSSQQQANKLKILYNKIAES